MSTRYSIRSALFLTMLAALGACQQSTSTTSAPDSGGMTSIPGLSEAVGAGDVASVRELLEQGAHPDRPVKLGLTPLMSAANNDQPEIARLLIGAGADVFATGMAGLTAAHIAARADAVETLKVLLEAGADPASRSKSGMNALDHAADGGAPGAAEFLVSEAGLDLDQPSQVVTQGHGYPRDVGPTPLAIAVRAGHLETVEKLLSLGAEVNAQSTAGNTPLLLAVFFAKQPELVEVLLDSGADPMVRARCELGCAIGEGAPLTAVEWAVELGRDELVELFESR